MRDKWSFPSSARFYLKPIIKEYLKYYRNKEIIYKSLDSSILLTRLGLLDEQARLAFLLKYYYGFSYKKIAQYLPISERKAKQVIYSSLIIYTNNGKLVPIHHIEDVIKKEVSILKSSLQLNQVTEKKTLHIETSKRSWRKSPVILLTLLVLFAGGSINQETLGKTRVSLGPDVYKYYKQGGIFQLNEEIQQKGYPDIYTYPDVGTDTLNLQFYTPESLENKEEVTALIEAYLKERDLDYVIEYEEITQEIEVEQTEEQNVADKQMEMEQEIFQLVTAKPYYYMQSYTSDQSGESTELILSDKVTEEEKMNLKGEIETIISKYNLEWNFSFGSVEAEVVEMEKAIWEIYPALAEAYVFSKNNYKIYDIFPSYVDGVLEISVYTEISLSTDEEIAKNQDLLNELKRSLRFFLHYEDIQELLHHVPYVMKVFGKNGNEIQLDT